MSKRFLNILYCVFSLLIGSLLYVLFRHNTYIAKLFNHFPFISEIRNAFSVIANDFLKFYFPDFLWGFALYCGLTAFFELETKKIIGCGIVAFLCGLFWEWAQFLGIVSGTGDFLDIVLYFIASISGIIINLRGERK